MIKNLNFKTSENKPSSNAQGLSTLQHKLKFGELKININPTSFRNENLSPNSNTSKNSGTLNFPNTTKNFNPVKKENMAPLSGRNVDNNKEKKLFKMNSISELNKKKIESKCFNVQGGKDGQNNKKTEGGVKANLERVKISHKNFGVIESYSAITTEGLYRDYNEDRVAIIFNISKPTTYVETEEQPWPKCSFFGLYDGHGGSGCADFLRDNLHKYIINDANFPKNPQKAILNGFVKIEKTFLQNCIISEKTETGERINVIDRSGSCAIAVLIIEKRCYIANVGDSRAIMSGNFGEKVYSLSRDHRPNDEKEYKRVLDAGGKIYQTEANIKGSENTNILGPLRVVPGKLSVSRTIGDIEAKDPRCGGNPNVVIATPEIKYFDITPTNDFIIIGCDGIYEKLKSKEIIDSMWNVINNPKMESVQDNHNLGGILLENLVDKCFEKKSTDNLTAVIITFKNNLRDKEGHLDSNYISNTQQLNKIPKVVKTDSNSNLPSSFGMNQNLLAKIIKNSQTKQSEKFIPINK